MPRFLMVPLFALALLALFSLPLELRGAELTVSEVTNSHGDGADGKGNTADDTWQFWLQLVHNPNQFVPLDIYTGNMTADQRQNGIRDEKARRGRQKVQGPIASKLPNPRDTEGWIFHTDWDGRFEGVWGDKKTGAVMCHPYVEKVSHCAVAVTYKIPDGGKYHISGGVTDLMVDPGYYKNDGIEWRVELVEAGKVVRHIGKGGPVGDGHGRPDSEKFDFKAVEAKQGQLIRLVIHPRAWWGSDLTRIDALKIEKAQ